LSWHIVRSSQKRLFPPKEAFFDLAVGLAVTLWTSGSTANDAAKQKRMIKRKGCGIMRMKIREWRIESAMHCTSGFQP